MQASLIERTTVRQPVSLRGFAAEARIVLGAVGGMVVGLCAGGLVFQSLVVGLFGAMGGAVFGMIGAAMAGEEPVG